ncbi:MAG: chemotaxis protein CheW [Thermoanaerobaculia bacterium]|nr:chemotaxis protein CheW [Thermoanaerobaculia bacterium]
MSDDDLLVPVEPPRRLTPSAERFVVFTAGGQLFAFSAARLLELGEVPAWTPLPRVPAWILGLANLRGDIVAVVDLGPLWRRPAADPAQLTRLLLVGSPGGQPVAGLVAERVWGVVPVAAAVLLPPLDGAVPEAVAAFDHPRGVVSVLDLDRLLPALTVGRSPAGTPSGVPSVF